MLTYHAIAQRTDRAFFSVASCTRQHSQCSATSVTRTAESTDVFGPSNHSDTGLPIQNSNPKIKLFIQKIYSPIIYTSINNEVYEILLIFLMWSTFYYPPGSREVLSGLQMTTFTGAKRARCVFWLHMQDLHGITAAYSNSTVVLHD
jgi:hypothetical protein